MTRCSRQRPGPWAKRGIGPLLAAAGLLLSTASFAAQGVVFSSFSGPRGDEAAARVRQALRGVRTVSAGAYAKAKRTLGAEKAARKLGVAAKVRGSIVRVHGRFALKIIVSSTAGKVLASQTFLLRSNRIDPTTAASAARTIASAVRRARPPRKPRARRRKKAAAVAAAPTPKPAPVKTAPATQPTLPMGPPPDNGLELEIDSAIGDEWSGREHGAQREETDTETSIGFVVSRPGEAGAAPRQRARNSSRLPVADGTDSGTPRTRRSARRYATTSTAGASTRYSSGSKSRARRRSSRTASNQRMPMVRRLPNEEIAEETQPEEPEDPDAPRQWSSIIRASAGLALVNRSLKFSGAEISNYVTPGLIPALYAGGVIYPLALFLDDWLGDLGFAARIYHAVGLRSEAADGGQSATDMLQMVDLGPRFRWTVADSPRSPMVLFGVDFGWQVYRPGKSESSGGAIFPNAVYPYLKPSLALDWPFLASGSVRGGANASVDVPVVLKGEPFGNPNDPLNRYGPAKTFAFEVSFGFYASVAGFFGQLDFFYRHFQMSFDTSACFDTGCISADGARDVYMGTMAHVGYSY